MNEYISARYKIRDVEDLIKIQVYGKLKYEPYGSFISVRGTETNYKNAPIVNMGYSFNMPENSNTEVLLLSDGSSVNHKIAVLTIPRDKHRHWKENTGGIQSPTNPKQAVEFNPKRVQVRGGNIALGDNGQIEINGNDVIIRGNLKVSGNLSVQGNIEVEGSVKGLKSATFNSSVSTSTLNAPVKTITFTPTFFNIHISGFEDY